MEPPSAVKSGRLGYGSRGSRTLIAGLTPRVRTGESSPFNTRARARAALLIQQFLNGPNVVAVFEQVRYERMPERVATDVLVDVRRAGRLCALSHRRARKLPI